MAMKSLHMKSDTTLISMPFQRPNLLFSIRKYDGDIYNEPDLLQLIEDVENGSIVRTMIFCQSVKKAGLVYEMFSNLLEEQMFTEGHEHDIPYAIVNMMHAPADPVNKASIITQLDDPNSCLKVIITTSSLALGVNTKGVRRVLHLGPPSKLADYIQQCGRAGRETQMEHVECPAVLLWTPSDLRFVDGSMKIYCKLDVCLRKYLFSYLNPDDVYSHPSGLRCCSICDQLS